MSDRRVSTPADCAEPDAGRSSGGLRRALGAARAGLYRTLARDDDRVAYWIRHVRIGVLVTELSALAVLAYALLTDEPTRDTPALLAVTFAVIVATPAILLLPLRAMLRDWRGPTLFYLWSLATTAVVIAVTWLDGGAASPLDALMFVTLTYLAVAYPPQGVVAMGSVMTAAYLVCLEMPALTSRGAFFVGVMAVFTIVCAMSSANSWAAYDRQVELIRAQETLASTDALTGIPNRRLFLQRVAAAVDGAAAGRASVVYLVDLDGFKAVNDAEGHGAGDALLTAVAAALGSAVRESDTVARLGGDEFAVLADAPAGFSAAHLAERLRAAVATSGAGLGVTASVGVAEIERADDVEDLLYRADAAMYRAKGLGGDRVERAVPLHSPATPPLVLQ